jgi:RNA polymerase sigma-70 factor (ECF subfamily)
MGRFATTRWSLILASRSESASARQALEQLCSAYRAPVLAYVRQRGYPHEQAEDLTQGFFVHFIGARIHHSVDPERGRFRTYLLSSIRHFLADAAAAAGTAKRGGALPHQALDDLVAAPDDESPERAFEKRWALTVVDRALERLGGEAAESGKQALFAELQPFLVEKPALEDYDGVAARLGLRRNSVAVAVHRLRHRLRELVRDELSLTVATPDDVDAELRALREVLGGAASEPL